MHFTLHSSITLFSIVHNIVDFSPHVIILHHAAHSPPVILHTLHHPAHLPPRSTPFTHQTTHLPLTTQHIFHPSYSTLYIHHCTLSTHHHKAALSIHHQYIFVQKVISKILETKLIAKKITHTHTKIANHSNPFPARSTDLTGVLISIQYL